MKKNRILFRIFWRFATLALVCVIAGSYAYNYGKKSADWNPGNRNGYYETTAKRKAQQNLGKANTNNRFRGEKGETILNDEAMQKIEKTAKTSKFPKIKELGGQDIPNMIKSISIGREGAPNQYHRADWKPVHNRMHVWSPDYSKRETYRNWSALHNIYLPQNDADNGLGLCLYTNKLMSIKSMQYDHIIPLKYANDHGASHWTNEQKIHFATDLDVALTVSGHENMAKGAKGPSKYMPAKNRKEYAVTWLLIAQKYNLSLDPEDMQTIKNELKDVKKNEKIKRINLYDQEPFYK